MRRLSGCASVVFIAGNDGSGKSTFQERLARRLAGRGLRVRTYHYYNSWVREVLRGLMERVVGVSQRKRQMKLSGGPEPATGRSVQRAEARRCWLACEMRGLAVGVFLWGYQLAMLAETWLRSLLSRADVVLVNRGFVDDLISTSLTLRCELPIRLLRFSGRTFPIRRQFYLSAGHEVEYARIVHVDLSPEFHRFKGQRYDQAVQVLEELGVPVRRVNTGRRVWWESGTGG